MKPKWWLIKSKSKTGSVVIDFIDHEPSEGLIDSLKRAFTETTVIPLYELPDGYCIVPIESCPMCSDSGVVYSTENGGDYFKCYCTKKPNSVYNQMVIKTKT